MPKGISDICPNDCRYLNSCMHVCMVYVAINKWWQDRLQVLQPHYYLCAVLPSLHSLSGSVALLLSDLMGRGARALREEQRGCQTVGLCGWLKVRGSKRWDNGNPIKKSVNRADRLVNARTGWPLPEMRVSARLFFLKFAIMGLVRSRGT